LRLDGFASGTEARRHREVDRKLGDDGRFRPTGVADDVKRLPQVFDAELHAVTSIC
jgi:hypothetical protein